MEGKGAYNRSSRVQAAGLLPAIALFADAARAVPLSSTQQPVFIADYGASQGHNSLTPIAAALAVIRARVGMERSVFVFHTDLASNDFSSLFETLSTDLDSYLRSDRAVFAAAVGRSYFEQILPASSVSLGWSSWAIQWLSRTPAEIPDQVQIAYSHDTAARDAYAQQAADDWRVFLRMRSRELCAGGRLVVLTMATDERGDFGYRPLLEAIYATLVDLVHAGVVREDEFRKMAIPTFARTRTEFAAPFSDRGCFDDLSIEHLDVFHGDDRIYAEFEQNRDPRAYAAQWAAFSRASVFPTLAAALDSGAGDTRRAAFFDAMEAGIAERVARTPERMSIPLAKMTLVKAT